MLVSICPVRFLSCRSCLPLTSLAQFAREITGAHWSGPRFFGLNRVRSV
ncbi:MAG: DUF2924 domain-containing protein [Planctomycetota bacterium]